MDTLNDERRVTRALMKAQVTIRRFGRQADGPEIIAEVLKDVADIRQRAERWTGAPRLAQIPGNVMHTSGEAAESFKQRMREVAAGQSVENVFNLRPRSVSDEELLTLEAVERLFRKHVFGLHKERDWKILLLRSAECNGQWLPKRKRPKRQATVRHVADQIGCSKSTIDDRWRLQTAAIWRGVESLLPMTGQIEIAA